MAASSRNAKVTGQVRILADLIDAHPDLGEVYMLSSTCGEVTVQVAGPNLAAALLAWFSRLGDAAISRTVLADGERAHVQVTGTVADVGVRVYAGFWSTDAVATLAAVPSVHTLRRLQIAGAW